jgi:hypothetical protein
MRQNRNKPQPFAHKPSSPDAIFMSMRLIAANDVAVGVAWRVGLGASRPSDMRDLCVSKLDVVV